MYVSDKSAGTLQVKLQAVLDELSAWFHSWAVAVNHSKSAVMVLTTRRSVPSVNVNLDGIPLPQVTSHKHLGLMINSHLSFQRHVIHTGSFNWVFDHYHNTTSKRFFGKPNLTFRPHISGPSSEHWRGFDKDTIFYVSGVHHLDFFYTFSHLLSYFTCELHQVEPEFTKFISFVSV